MPVRRKHAYKPGEQIDIRITPWLVDGILREGVNNMLVALPKTGKSALCGAMVGAMAAEQPEFLGRKLESLCQEVHLIWPDMPLEDAVYILEREGLWQGSGIQKNAEGRVTSIQGSPHPLIVEFVTADLDVREWDFRPANLARYREEALDAKKRGVKALWCFDCYEIMCGFASGFNENAPEAGKPAREMCLAFAGTGATTLTIHHSNKSGGGTAVLSSSGHASITRPFSTLTQMTWLKPAQQGATQSDMRVVISQIGRRGSGQLVAELKGEGDEAQWVLHGDGADAMEDERQENEWLKLEHNQAAVFAHLADRTRAGFGVPVTELMDALNLKKDKVQRPLKALLRKGLVRVEKGAYKKPGPGAPGDFWYSAYDPDGEGAPNLETGDLKSKKRTESGFEGFESPGLSTPFTEQSTPQKDSTPRKKFNGEWGAISEKLYLAPVEVLENGRWHNGWKCNKCESPHDLHLVKFVEGDMWTRQGKRWEIDVRFCTKTQLIEDDDDII